MLIRISAYMDPRGASEPMDWWTVINRCRAIENVAAVVACNQGASMGHYPPFSWPGASMVTDHDGRILARAPDGPGQTTVVAPVSIETIRQERRRRSGHAMPAHLRGEAYPLQQQSMYPPNPSVESRSTESLEQSIDRAKGRLGW